MLDGEIVCLDRKGNSQFTNLLFRRGEPRFYAFDLLSCNGEDLCYFPLADRKHKLCEVVPHEAERLLYCDHIEERGEHLFRLACKRDLECIVAKRKFDPYLPRQRKVVQDQESQLLAVGGAREIIRAGTLGRSQVALLECVCLSKRQLPVLEHSRIQLSHPRQDYAVGATRPWQNNIEGQMGKFFICSYAGQS